MGSAGDVFPFLGLGELFRASGHDVTLYTCDHFEFHAARMGIGFQALGPKGIYESSIVHPDLWHPQRSFGYLYRTMCEPVLEDQFSVVADWCRQQDAIALVNCFGFGALCAQEATNANVFSVHLQPSVLASYADPPALPNVVGPKFLRRILLWLGGKMAIDPIVCPTLNEFRRRKGLPPIGDIMHWWSSKAFNVMLFPEWFAAPASDWPQNMFQSSFPLWEANSEDSLPAAVQDFLNQPSGVVAITAGSANLFGKKIFQCATDACLQLGYRPLYLSAGEDQLPSPIPEHALVCPFVALSKLLPHCRAIINHGGVGTVSQAIAAGIPQLVIPIAHDQFDNAERVVRLGIGEKLQANKLNSVRISDLLAKLLGNDAAAKNSKRLAAEIDGKKALADTVGSIIAAAQRQLRTTNI
jgi:UDP:flavonoid glycosyltransferase YjiC (YdhE family)